MFKAGGETAVLEDRTKWKQEASPHRLYRKKSSKRQTQEKT